MLILSAKNITKSYGIDTVLKDINFNVNSDDKIGIVGVNGAGKSTLLKILAGLLSPDEGEVKIYGVDTKVGYLDQNGVFDSPNTVYYELLSVFDDLMQLEKEIHQKEREISSCDDGDRLQQLLDEYAAMRDRFEKSGGFEFESRIKGVLAGLGFGKESYEMPISALSGGEKTRIALGKLLLKKPDILLLDEPTNHLDLDSCEWLEDFLRDYKGCVMIVSHDRYFLDKTTNRTFYIKNGKLSEYNGNYSYYVQQSQLQKEIAEKRYKQQQREIARIKEIIAVQKARGTEKSVKMAQSKQKMLDRMELVEKPEGEDPQPYFFFDIDVESSNDVLKVENLSKSFDRQIFKGVSFSIQKQERVAIIGPNGSGKSTVFKIICGVIPSDSGTIQYGNNVRIGYYDQELSSLHPDKSVLDELWDEYPRMTQTEVRSILGCFLFKNDDVFKKVKDLSGGEKARLCMAKLMLKNANFLLLDEPTNHLDINSKEALEDALKNYQGTILAISHDRYFVNKIATRILELTPEGVVNYLGNYDYYIEKKKKENIGTQPLKSQKSKTQERNERKKEREKKQLAAQHKRQLSELEQNIIDTEKKIAEYEKLLCNPDIYKDPTKAADINREYNSLKKQLDNLYEQWAFLLQ
ncbi:ABC-F family ATP-binding cassette domain-containing protein [Caldanaerobius polysaccharolyticus]|uniref:ABC-F family ATP-binding cassette domain-containing protein n=1 Tax=Caldanaerobius polysaccharolyticus TaxID=44256 RepID=UPI00047E37D8|nr:ABC-F type ribosomal protection protein [Caldanaerobius polysaccharolyticus]